MAEQGFGKPSPSTAPDRTVTLTSTTTAGATGSRNAGAHALPVTGGPTDQLAGLAALTLVAGAGLVLSARRRRT